MCFVFFQTFELSFCGPVNRFVTGLFFFCCTGDHIVFVDEKSARICLSTKVRATIDLYGSHGVDFKHFKRLSEFNAPPDQYRSFGGGFTVSIIHFASLPCSTEVVLSLPEFVSKAGAATSTPSLSVAITALTDITKNKVVRTGISSIIVTKAWITKLSRACFNGNNRH